MSPLQYIRASLALIVAPPLTIVVSALALLDLTFFRKSPAKALVFPRMWARITCRIAGVRVQIEGLENIEADQTYIFAANHASQFDIFTLQGYFPHDFRWIAKKELFRIPIFGTAMQRTGFIAMDRTHGRAALKSLNKAAEQIAGGTSVIIFPEGTRSRDGRLHPFKAGAIMLAIKAGVPVVPIGINGTYEILPKGRLLADSGEVVIRVGTPIPTADFTAHDKQELARQLHDRVEKLL
ncbi:Acyl-CoA:1-acyl-sn-glycerol-3-phosphate acyltransferase [hydrothermal vent metagenome]|uniref:Acyl-CoA:1-acyl-sn-glycerol-3-phosphate acyltransferase n=1 Tax=hydrothermal vent metagenome TaxID=652676 RepID=A0A3B0V6X0_9ZZZZ